ncbi:serine/threonine-protein kinase [Methylorubrum extorquens]|uniref:Serine/threonine protein kinase n=1 Tax=Methylorubrum extorquens TaxID=408 RepID=A0AAX3WC61_METEX|nr:serine/threonine-protein kinase [Methylorubrum extorquens]WHQ68571.1 serine/threonine protein kinase [Methylorubrum extorquens]
MSGERTVVTLGAGSRAGPGTRLNDLYEIDALIAAGGMGEVFRGHAIETGDTVAIKVMRAEFAENVNALALFRKEASALHNVHHGAVVRYYVFSVDRRLGLPYLAMEYLTGESLAERLKRGRLDSAEVDILRRRLAGGLGAAHEAGIIHRDVTPDNIILPGGDPARAKIIDFGIARLAETQTVIGDGFAGKYRYVSPEQLGLQGGEITPRSDIYSLGLVLAQASRGHAVEMGDDPVASISKRSAVPDLSGVDPRLLPLLESMLRPDPRLRPESMAVVEAWEAAQTRLAPRAAAAAAPKPRQIGLAVGGGAVALAGGLAAFALLWPADTPPVVETGPALVEKPRPPTPPRPALPPAEIPPEAPQPPAAEMPQPPSAEAALLPADAVAQPTPIEARQPLPTEATRPEAASPPSQPPPRPTARLDPVPAPVTEPGPPTSPAEPTMEAVAAYIRGYRGGACFFLNPTTVSAQEAVIEAYGTEAKPFVAFDTAFRNTFGFEAKIQLRQIEPGQCPVVALLAQQAQAKPVGVPKLRLDGDRLRSGEELRGTIDPGEARSIALFLIERDGSVRDLGPHLKRAGRRTSFAVRVEASPASRGRSQLVVAVGSREPVAVAGAGGEPDSTALFAGLVREMGRPGAGIGLAAQQIKVGN